MAEQVDFAFVVVHFRPHSGETGKVMAMQKADDTIAEHQAHLISLA